jgi:glycosyltransferase involved in cell wall biosynthesis
MTVVAPSRWLADLCRHSMLREATIHHIPNGVDVDVFQPRDPRDCRARLGLPHDKLVIMFASAALNDPMKGGPLLLEALQGLPPDVKAKTVLLLLGDRSDAIGRVGGIETIGLGYVKDDATKVEAYSAADIFVLPSRAENHSLVLVEALACGAPCVAFDVGGNPEIVRDGVTGCLARRDHADELRDGITRLAQDEPMRRVMAAQCRQVAIEEFSLDLHARRYLELFEDVLEHKPATQPLVPLTPLNGRRRISSGTASVPLRS